MAITSPSRANSHPFCPFLKPQLNMNENKHTFISAGNNTMFVLCGTHDQQSDAGITRFGLFILLHQNRKQWATFREASVDQTEPGWGWLSCTQGNVMTKQHVPQFSGGLGKPPSRGASPQCRPAYCYVATVCLSRLVPQSSGSTSSQHDVSPSSILLTF